MTLEDLQVLDVESLAYSLGIGDRCDCGELAWCGPSCVACEAEGLVLNGLVDELEGN